MGTTIITIGATLIKMGALGGLGAGLITGIKWFGKFEPNLKGKGSKGGGDNDSTSVEHLRKAVRQQD